MSGEIGRWVAAAVAFGLAPLVASVVARLPRGRWLGIAAGTAAGAVIALFLDGRLIVAI